MTGHERALERLNSQRMLAAAPRLDGARDVNVVRVSQPSRQNGTWVRVKAYDIAGQNGGPASKQHPDHMFIEYDDGNRQIIARGGPSAQGKQFFVDHLTGRLTVKAEVGPAETSPDYRRGERLLYETFVPYKSAQEVSEVARQEMRRVNQGRDRYGADRNSNSYVGNVTERQFGRRIGDDQTWGYQTRLGERPPTR